MYGKGRCELDALEAVVPGELARIVENYILRYRDETIEDNLERCERIATERMTEAWDDATGPTRKRIEDWETKLAAINDKHADARTKLAADIEQDLAPLRVECEDIEEEIRDDLDTAAEELEDVMPVRPEESFERCDPDFPNGDPDDVLFNSSRSFADQLGYYKRHKRGEI